MSTFRTLAPHHSDPSRDQGGGGGGGEEGWKTVEIIRTAALNRGHGRLREMPNIVICFRKCWFFEVAWSLTKGGLYERWWDMGNLVPTWGFDLCMQFPNTMVWPPCVQALQKAYETSRMGS